MAAGEVLTRPPLDSIAAALESMKAQGLETTPDTLRRLVEEVAASPQTLETALAEAARIYQQGLDASNLDQAVQVTNALARLNRPNVLIQIGKLHLPALTRKGRPGARSRRILAGVTFSRGPVMVALGADRRLRLGQSAGSAPLAPAVHIAAPPMADLAHRVETGALMINPFALALLSGSAARDRGLLARPLVRAVVPLNAGYGQRQTRDLVRERRALETALLPTVAQVMDWADAHLPEAAARRFRKRMGGFGAKATLDQAFKAMDELGKEFPADMDRLRQAARTELGRRLTIRFVNVLHAGKLDPAAIRDFDTAQYHSYELPPVAVRAYLSDQSTKVEDNEFWSALLDRSGRQTAVDGRETVFGVDAYGLGRNAMRRLMFADAPPTNDGRRYARVSRDSIPAGLTADQSRDLANDGVIFIPAGAPDPLGARGARLDRELVMFIEPNASQRNLLRTLVRAHRDELRQLGIPEREIPGVVLYSFVLPVLVLLRDRVQLFTMFRRLQQDLKEHPGEGATLALHIGGAAHFQSLKTLASMDQDANSRIRFEDDDDPRLPLINGATMHDSFFARRFEAILDQLKIEDGEITLNGPYFERLFEEFLAEERRTLAVAGILRSVHVGTGSLLMEGERMTDNEMLFADNVRGWLSALDDADLADVQLGVSQNPHATALVMDLNRRLRQPKYDNVRGIAQARRKLDTQVFRGTGRLGAEREDTREPPAPAAPEPVRLTIEAVRDMVGRGTVDPAAVFDRLQDQTFESWNAAERAVAGVFDEMARQKRAGQPLTMELSRQIAAGIGLDPDGVAAEVVVAPVVEGTFLLHFLPWFPFLHKNRSWHMVLGMAMIYVGAFAMAAFMNPDALVQAWSGASTVAVFISLFWIWLGGVVGHMAYNGVARLLGWARLAPGPARNLARPLQATLERLRARFRPRLGDRTDPLIAQIWLEPTFVNRSIRVDRTIDILADAVDHARLTQRDHVALRALVELGVSFQRRLDTLAALVRALDQIPGRDDRRRVIELMPAAVIRKPVPDADALVRRLLGEARQARAAESTDDSQSAPDVSGVAPLTRADVRMEVSQYGVSDERHRYLRLWYPHIRAVFSMNFVVNEEDRSLRIETVQADNLSRLTARERRLTADWARLLVEEAKVEARRRGLTHIYLPPPIAQYLEWTAYWTIPGDPYEFHPASYVSRRHYAQLPTETGFRLTVEAPVNFSIEYERMISHLVWRYDLPPNPGAASPDTGVERQAAEALVDFATALAAGEAQGRSLNALAPPVVNFDARSFGEANTGVTSTLPALNEARFESELSRVIAERGRTPALADPAVARRATRLFWMMGLRSAPALPEGNLLFADLKALNESLPATPVNRHPVLYVMVRPSESEAVRQLAQRLGRPIVPVITDAPRAGGRLNVDGVEAALESQLSAEDLASLQFVLAGDDLDTLMAALGRLPEGAALRRIRYVAIEALIQALVPLSAADLIEINTQAEALAARQA
jgi:hypothetical protein